MIFIYISILAVGIFSIIIILLKNKKNQELQPSDLLKNISIDDDEQADPSSSFLKRLRNQEPKKPLGQPQPISSEEAVESLKTQTDRANTKATGQDFEKSSQASEDLKKQLQDAHAHIQKLRGDLELSKKEIERSQELISNLKNQVRAKEEEIQSIQQQQVEGKKNMPMDNGRALKEPAPSSEPHNELSPRNNNDVRSQNKSNESNESFINPKNNEKNPESEKKEHQEEIAESQKNINSSLNLKDLSKKDEQQQKQKEEKSESEGITLLSPDDDPIDSPDLVKKDNLDSEKKLDESQNQNSDNPKLRLNNDEE